MNAIRTFLSAGALWLSWTLTPSAGQTQPDVNPMPFRNQGTPVDFIRDLYAHFDGDESMEPQLQDRDASILADPQLLKLFRDDREYSTGELGALEANPLCDCQEKPPSLKQILLLEQTKMAAKVQVIFNTYPIVLDFSLLEIDGAWKIHDIYDEVQDEDLLQIMKTSVNSERDDYLNRHMPQ